MREIKFRAWSEKLKKILPNAVFQLEDGNLHSAYDTYMTGDLSLMQFTGLHDKNGTPIYEGDILSNKTGRICKVVWFEAQACFDAKPLTSKGTSALFTPNYWRHCEVIGNIYENKELIP